MPRDVWRIGGTAPLILNLGTRWEVRFKLQRASYSGRSGQYSSNRRLGQPQVGFNSSEKRQPPFFTLLIEQRFLTRSARSLVIILTELSQLETGYL